MMKLTKKQSDWVIGVIATVLVILIFAGMFALTDLPA